MLINRKLKHDLIFDQKLNKTPTSNFKSQTSLTQSKLKPLQQSQQTYKQSLLNGINHPRIREIILKHQNLPNLLSSSNSNLKQNLKNSVTHLQLMQQRKWLTKKGKKFLVDFDDNERKQMKNCFNSMDQKQSGSIGIDELEELLISVGLMQTREEVKKIFDAVDEDKSGNIQFSEFLKMILNDEGQNSEIVKFFKQVINVNKKKNQKIINSIKDRSYQVTERSQNNQESPIKQVKLGRQLSSTRCYNSMEKSSLHPVKSTMLDSQEHQSLLQRMGQSSVLNIFEKHPHPKNLSFGMLISHIRRKHMLTALRIGEGNSGDDIKSSTHYASNSLLKSSNNMRDSKVSLYPGRQMYTEQQVQKGKNVMNNLRKMWDRRMLRQIRQAKSKNNQNLLAATNSITQKEKQKKSGFPHIS